MKAVQVRRPGGGQATHWLAPDGEWTFCGLRIRVLLSMVILDLEHLPAGDGCAACDEVRERTPRGGRNALTTLPPSTGVLRTTGPLYHGARTRHAGRRL